MKTTQPQTIRILSDAIGAEDGAAKQLDAARAKREAAEKLQAEWQQMFRDFCLIQRAQLLASTDPLAYIAARDREEFQGNEILVIRNYLAMQKSFREFQDGIFISLGFVPSDGSDESLFGPTSRTMSVLEALEGSTLFIALKARAETFAAARADEFAGQLAAKAAELAA